MMAAPKQSCLMLCIAFLLGLCGSGFGQVLLPMEQEAFDVETGLLLNPFLHPQSCGRGSPQILTSAICDPWLHITNKDRVEGILNSFTIGVGAVAVVDHLPKGYDVESYARSTHDAWGIGDETKQNGLLLFLSIRDRKIYISLGTGLLKLISDHLARSVIANMKPSLRKKDYTEAISLALLELDDILKTNEERLQRGALPYKFASEYQRYLDGGDNEVGGGGGGGRGIRAVAHSVNSFLQHHGTTIFYATSIPLCVGGVLSHIDWKLRREQLARERFQRLLIDADELGADPKSCPHCLSNFTSQVKDSVQGLPQYYQQMHGKTLEVVAVGGKKMSVSRPSTVPVLLACGHYLCSTCCSALFPVKKQHLFLTSNISDHCPVCLHTQSLQKPATKSFLSRLFQNYRGSRSRTPANIVFNFDPWDVSHVEANPIQQKLYARNQELSLRVRQLHRAHPSLMNSEVKKSINTELEERASTFARPSYHHRALAEKPPSTRASMAKTVLEAQARHARARAQLRQLALRSTYEASGRLGSSKGSGGRRKGKSGGGAGGSW